MCYYLLDHLDHQPGDVEAVYEKNENDEIKRKKKMSKDENMKRKVVRMGKTLKQSEEKYKCNQCSYTAKQKAQVKDHMDSVHE